MDPRIEIAEVVSFRLKLPLAELERVPRETAPELQLSLSREGAEWLLESRDGDSALRFRPAGQDAVLTEIAICNDDGGAFFQRVLGPLLVRFQGDCELRLVWNIAARNTHGDFAAVTVRRGQTNYPGLSHPAQALRNALVAGPPSLGEGPSAEPERAAAPPPDPNPDEQEIERLLNKGRELFAEYQRARAARMAKE